MLLTAFQNAEVAFNGTTLISVSRKFVNKFKQELKRGTCRSHGDFIRVLAHKKNGQFQGNGFNVITIQLTISYDSES
jgi:hypothetical protein